MKCPFNLRNKKQVIRFDEVDPYNPKNRVKGYVNRRQGSLYGSLYITHVNDKPCYQLIHSAPKQHYPFDKEDNWKFPEYDYIELYEKIDGTCIINYNYHNGKEWFTTYKTRLRPFLGSGRYGNFFELWNEMLEKYPNIRTVCKNPHYHYIFELYGKRNKILMDYEIPLDTTCVFVVCNWDGSVISPDNIEQFYSERIPMLSIIGFPLEEISKDGYIEIKDKLEEELDVDEENKIMRGKEGYVMYFIQNGYAVQIKNKPPSVLKYHWGGDAIPYESVYTTVVNAFENFDEPTFEDVVGLLEEEFDMNKIEKSKIRITKCLDKVLFDRKFRSKLAGDYKKLGVNINDDKVTVMRWFGQHYPRGEAKRIYRALKQYEEKK